MDAVLPGHGTVQHYVPSICIPPRAGSIVHSSFLVPAFLCSSDLLGQEFSSSTFALLLHLPHERSQLVNWQFARVDGGAGEARYSHQPISATRACCGRLR